MYRREHRRQLSFEDFFLPFGDKLSGDNRWIKLASSFHEMDWRMSTRLSSARVLEIQQSSLV
jgi:hypothetical protein